ncbi:MAG: hypothetical protein EXR84_04210 [Gammaproteobacteria bacterium]|nr:hypothetical protein [Gammaproteobacteria bacterium]
MRTRVRKKVFTSHRLYCLLTAGCALLAAIAVNAAEGIDAESAIVGSWVVNEKLSDNTDDQVEAAIKEAGGKGSRGWFNREEEFYRGGPAEQELYDRISYDKVLTIEYGSPEFRFQYADNFTRVFHTDGRRRQSAANSFFTGGGEDFSFANWNGDKLIVEARPRDGGFTLETYSLQANGQQLRVEMVIEPDGFGAAINLVRVYDRRD